MVFHSKPRPSKTQNQKSRHGKNQSAGFGPAGYETEPQEYKGKDGLAGTDGYVVDKK